MTYEADMSSNKTSGEEACSGPAKYGEIVKHHEERQDLEWDNKI